MIQTIERIYPNLKEKIEAQYIIGWDLAGSPLASGVVFWIFVTYDERRGEKKGIVEVESEKLILTPAQ